jgi:hypothetical protein
MHASQVVIEGTLKPDGTLELRQPIDLPPGNVQVIVQTLPMAAHPGEDARIVLQRIWDERKSLGMRGRTKDQIDADIQAMRDEWDR